MRDQLGSFEIDVVAGFVKQNRAGLVSRHLFAERWLPILQRQCKKIGNKGQIDDFEKEEPTFLFKMTLSAGTKELHFPVQLQKMCMLSEVQRPTLRSHYVAVFCHSHESLIIFESTTHPTY